MKRQRDDLVVETDQNDGVGAHPGRETKTGSLHPISPGRSGLVGASAKRRFLCSFRTRQATQLESEFAWEKTVTDEPLRRTTKNPSFSVVSSPSKAYKKTVFRETK